MGRLHHSLNLIFFQSIHDDTISPISVKRILWFKRHSLEIVQTDEMLSIWCVLLGESNPLQTYGFLLVQLLSGCNHRIQFHLLPSGNIMAIMHNCLCVSENQYRSIFMFSVIHQRPIHHFPGYNSPLSHCKLLCVPLYPVVDDLEGRCADRKDCVLDMDQTGQNLLCRCNSNNCTSKWQTSENIFRISVEENTHRQKVHNYRWAVPILSQLEQSECPLLKWLIRDFLTLSSISIRP